MKRTVFATGLALAAAFAWASPALAQTAPQQGERVRTPSHDPRCVCVYCGSPSNGVLRYPVPKPPYQEPPDGGQEDPPDSRQRRGSSTSAGLRFNDSWDFELQGIDVSGKIQLSETFTFSGLSINSPSQGRLSIDDLDFDALSGIDLTLRASPLSLFIRYDQGSTDLRVFVPGAAPGRGDISIEADWDVEAWEIGLERSMILADLGESFGATLNLMAGYYSITLDPTGGREDNSGDPLMGIPPSSVALNLSEERFSGFFYGAAIHVRGQIYDSLTIQASAQWVAFTGDAEANAIQFLIGLGWDF